MSLKNWDNKTWLSSGKYIKCFNNFLLKQIRLNQNSRILDIGCGRGKILGNLSSKLKLKKKPIGVDIEVHKDRDKRINFKRIDILKYLNKKQNKFDLILIKQTIHLLKFSDIRKLLFLCSKNLNTNGKIIIFTLQNFQNEIPTFQFMKKKLDQSFNRDKKIIKLISNLYPKNVKKKFFFKVEITKNIYIRMIKNRYISVLLRFSCNQILKGIDEIKTKYKEKMSFNDKLICIILN